MEITYTKFRQALAIVNKYKAQVEERLKNIEQNISGGSKYINCSPEDKFFDVDCSVRLKNLLKYNENKLGIEVDWDMKIKELSVISMSKFSACRGVGVTVLRELKELCLYAGVELRP